MGWGYSERKDDWQQCQSFGNNAYLYSKYIQILKIGNKCFAIAVCKDTVTYLCEVNEEELIYRENSTGGIHVDNFKAILDKYKKDKPED